MEETSWISYQQLSIKDEGLVQSHHVLVAKFREDVNFHREILNILFWFDLHLLQGSQGLILFILSLKNIKISN